MIINNPLKNARERGILIASHRGTFGGNIIQNTIPAFENALLHGADIIELDVVKSIDGVFCCFHENQESNLLKINEQITQMTSAQILSHSLFNNINEITNQKINTLDEILEHFKGRCLINIDKSWQYWSEIIKCLGKHNMYDQIILKSPPKTEFLKMLEDYRARIMYMPIINQSKQIDLTLSYKTNIVAVEVLFDSDGSELAQKEFIEKIHERNLFLWVNAIRLNDKLLLSGGHDDNQAIINSMDNSWGWLIKQGFDIIQTDWVALLKQYIRRNS